MSLQEHEISYLRKAAAREQGRRFLEGESAPVAPLHALNEVEFAKMASAKNSELFAVASVLRPSDPFSLYEEMGGTYKEASPLRPPVLVGGPSHAPPPGARVGLFDPKYQARLPSDLGSRDIYFSPHARARADLGSVAPAADSAMGRMKQLLSGGRAADLRGELAFLREHGHDLLPKDLASQAGKLQDALASEAKKIRAARIAAGAGAVATTGAAALGGLGLLRKQQAARQAAQAAQAAQSAANTRLGRGILGAGVLGAGALAAYGLANRNKGEPDPRATY